jgi:hypothetical protein
VNVATLSTHVAPFLHGYDEHSLMSNSQCKPAQPVAQVHTYCTTHAAAVHAPSVHAPPFMHGDDEHSEIGEQVTPPSDVS